MFADDPVTFNMMLDIIQINQSNSGNLAAEEASKPAAMLTSSDNAEIKANTEKTVNSAPLLN